MQTLLDLLSQLGAFVDSLAALVTDSPLTYVIVLLMAAVDVLLPILPAEATVTAAAVLAGQGQLSIAWVMLAAGLGAFIGDNVAYWIGRTAGRPVVERVLRGDRRRLESVAAQFHRRGGLFIIVGRFIPGGRTAVSVGAGVVRFSWPRFLLFDALAAVVWAVQAGLPGYIGGTLVKGSPWVALLLGFALSALLAGGIALAERWWSARRGRPDAPVVRPSVVGIERPGTGLPSGLDATVPVARTLGITGGQAGDDDGEADADPGHERGP